MYVVCMVEYICIILYIIISSICISYIEYHIMYIVQYIQYIISQYIYHSLSYKPVFLLASAPVSLVDMPKSDNIALPDEDSSILPALISRCILRCSCTCNRPSRLCEQVYIDIVRYAMSMGCVKRIITIIIISVYNRVMYE